MYFPALYGLLRMMDFMKPGIFYGVLPGYLKDPIQESGWVDNNTENIRTPAGNFRIARLHVRVGDPFMAKLLQSALDEINVSVDTSSNSLGIVKSSFFGTSREIIKTGIWTDR